MNYMKRTLTFGILLALQTPSLFSWEDGHEPWAVARYPERFPSPVRNRFNIRISEENYKERQEIHWNNFVLNDQYRRDEHTLSQETRDSDAYKAYIETQKGTVLYDKPVLFLEDCALFSQYFPIDSGYTNMKIRCYVPPHKLSYHDGYFQRDLNVEGNLCASGALKELLLKGTLSMMNLEKSLTIEEFIKRTPKFRKTYTPELDDPTFRFRISPDGRNGTLFVPDLPFTQPRIGICPDEGDYKPGIKYTLITSDEAYDIEKIYVNVLEQERLNGLFPDIYIEGNKIMMTLRNAGVSSDSFQQSFSAETPLLNSTVAHQDRDINRILDQTFIEYSQNDLLSLSNSSRFLYTTPFVKFGVSENVSRNNGHEFTDHVRQKYGSIGSYAQAGQYSAYAGINYGFTETSLSESRALSNVYSALAGVRFAPVDFASLELTGMYYGVNTNTQRTLNATPNFYTEGETTELYDGELLPEVVQLDTIFDQTTKRFDNSAVVNLRFKFLQPIKKTLLFAPDASFTFTQLFLGKGVDQNQSVAQFGTSSQSIAKLDAQVGGLVGILIPISEWDIGASIHASYITPVVRGKNNVTATRNTVSATKVSSVRYESLDGALGEEVPIYLDTRSYGRISAQLVIESPTLTSVFFGIQHTIGASSLRNYAMEFGIKQRI